MNNFYPNSQADGIRLHGYNWDECDPVAVVSLVHGLAEHCGRYDVLAAHLNSNGIAVVGVDLHGHGKTIGRRGVVRHYDDMHADVVTLLGETRRLYPDLPHFLFGHSMGGGLVLHHGLKTNDESLAGYLVSAPLIRITRRLPFFVRAGVKAIHRILPNGTMPIPVSGKNISTIPEEQDRYDNDPLNHNRLGLGLAVGMIESGETVLGQAATWNLPLRMWHSKSDPITDFSATEQFASDAQNCQFTPFDTVRHEMHQDTSREEVCSMIVEFVSSRL